MNEKEIVYSEERDIDNPKKRFRESINKSNPYDISDPFDNSVVNILVVSWLYIFIYILYLFVVKFLNLFTIVYFAIFNVILFSIYQISGTFLKKHADKELKACDTKFFDFWSVGHFFLHVTITSVVFIFTTNVYIILVINVVWMIFWESFEFLNYKKNSYYCENPLNRVSDMFFGMLGMIFYFFIINYIF